MAARKNPQAHPLDREIWIAKPDVNDAHLPASGISARCEIQMEAARKSRFDRKRAALLQQSADSGKRKPPCFTATVSGALAERPVASLSGLTISSTSEKKCSAYVLLPAPFGSAISHNQGLQLIQTEVLSRRLGFRPL